MNDALRSATIKLTAQYLGIIMAISMLFSIVIYFGVNREFVRFERFQERVKEERRLGILPTGKQKLQRIDPDFVEESRTRVALTLALINLGIVGVAGVGGYYLARKTLNPIKDMVDEQRRFIADASHELRTPLTSLRTEMEVQLLDKKLSTQTARKVIESNLEEVIELQSLSDKLLELAQYDRQNNQGSFETISLKAVAKEVTKNLSSIAKQKGVRLVNNTAVATVFGEKRAMRELLTILVDNSIKYCSKGGSVTISSHASHGSVFLTISDTGIGIPKRDLPHVFDRFYRGDDARSKSVTGYGLGLSIAKKIVSLHSGSIQVESDGKTGSKFVIALPSLKG